MVTYRSRRKLGSLYVIEGSMLFFPPKHQSCPNKKEYKNKIEKKNNPKNKRYNVNSIIEEKKNEKNGGKKTKRYT